MDRDTIIRLAREAGFAEGVAEIVGLEGFANFAELVLANAAKEAQISDAFAKALGQVDAHLANVDARIKTVQDAVLAEREACAQLCDDIWQQDGTAMQCRDAIRSRT